MNATNPYTHIVLSGGGMTGLAYIGIYRYLIQFDLFKHVHHIVGCSIGSIFACLYALNLTVEELEHYVYEFMLNSSAMDFPIDNLFQFLEKNGFFSMKNLETVLIYLFDKVGIKQPEQITFQEFSKYTGKNIYIATTCVNTRSCKIFSNIDTPNQAFIPIICASCSLPFLFEPIVIQEKLYVDGGTVNTLPIDCISHQPTDHILVIKLNFDPFLERMCQTKELLDDPLLYMIQILNAMLYSRTTINLKLCDQPNIHLLEIEEGPISFMPIDVLEQKIRIHITKEQYEQVIMYGYRCIYEWYKKKESKQNVVSQI
ncbi:MAG: Cafeteria roenbergensis virus [Bacteroidota bacterium]|jgi:NTE family protein